MERIALLWHELERLESTLQVLQTLPDVEEAQRASLEQQVAVTRQQLADTQQHLLDRETTTTRHVMRETERVEMESKEEHDRWLFCRPCNRQDPDQDGLAGLRRCVLRPSCLACQSLHITPPRRPDSLVQQVPALPAGWEAKWSAEHQRPYYIDHNTQSTSWDPPRPPVNGMCAPIQIPGLYKESDTGAKLLQRVQELRVTQREHACTPQEKQFVEADIRRILRRLEDVDPALFRAIPREEDAEEGTPPDEAVLLRLSSELQTYKLLRNSGDPQAQTMAKTIRAQAEAAGRRVPVLETLAMSEIDWLVATWAGKPTPLVLQLKGSCRDCQGTELGWATECGTCGSLSTEHANVFLPACVQAKPDEVCAIIMVEPTEQFPMPVQVARDASLDAADQDQEPEPEPEQDPEAEPQREHGVNQVGVFVAFEPCGCKIAVENFKEAVAHALANGGGAVRPNCRVLAQYPSARAWVQLSEPNVGIVQSQVIQHDEASGHWALLCPHCKEAGTRLDKFQHYKLAGEDAYARIKNWGLERSQVEAGGAVCPLAGCNQLIDRTHMPPDGEHKVTCPHCDKTFDR